MTHSANDSSKLVPASKYAPPPTTSSPWKMLTEKNDPRVGCAVIANISHFALNQ